MREALQGLHRTTDLLPAGSLQLLCQQTLEVRMREMALLFGLSFKILHLKIR